MPDSPPLTRTRTRTSDTVKKRLPAADWAAIAGGACGVRVSTLPLKLHFRLSCRQLTREAPKEAERCDGLCLHDFVAT